MATPPKRSPGGSALKRFTSRLRSSRRRKDVEIPVQDDEFSNDADDRHPSGRVLVYDDEDGGGGGGAGYARGEDGGRDVRDDEEGQDDAQASVRLDDDRELQAFADLLKGILNVNGTVARVQASLVSTERLTRTLKEQSGATLEVSKRGNSAGVNSRRHGVRATQSELDLELMMETDFDFDLHATEAALDRRRETARRLDAIRGCTLVGTLASFEDAAALLEQMQEDQEEPKGQKKGSETMGETTNDLELDELRTMLVDALLDMLARNRLSLDEDVRCVAGLLGRLAGPRVEMQCMLEYHGGVIRDRMRSVTLQPGFSREPAEELAGELGRVFNELVHAARQSCCGGAGEGQAEGETKETAWKAATFDLWALELAKGAREQLERLVVLPMAVPKGAEAVEACRARFLASSVV